MGSTEMENRIHNVKVAELIQERGPATASANPATGAEFQGILQDRLKVSGHAQTRLQSRQIELQDVQWERVLDGVQRAAEKGARESLVLVDDVAMIVSVKNRTLITVVDQANLRSNVFTNIDSAVIV